MALTGELTPIVLIPRFTSYMGASTPYQSIPLDVSAYIRGTLTMWSGPLVPTGVGADVTITVMESSDTVSWTTLGSHTFSTSTSYVLDVTLTRQYIRVVVVLSGTNPAVTVWCIGSLERRVN